MICQLVLVSCKASVGPMLEQGQEGVEEVEAEINF